MRRSIIAGIVCPMLLCALFPSCHRGKSEQIEVQVTPKTTAEVPVQAPVKTEICKPDNLNDQFSYTYGYMLFLALKNQGFKELDGTYFSKGVTDASEGGTSYFTQTEMEDILKQVQSKMLEQAKSEYAQLSEKNKAEAAEFLAKNKLVAGVVTLESGLQYQVIVPGDVNTAIKPSDTVTVDYKVATLDGTVVSSTYQRGHSENLKVSDVSYKILQSGFLMMHPGSQFRFWIPPSLAFGEEGEGSIGPNSLVVIDVTIKGVTAQPTT